MHVVVIQAAFNKPPKRLFESILALADITVITENDAEHEYHHSIKVCRIADTRDVQQVKEAFGHIASNKKVDRLFTPFERHQSIGGYIRQLFGIPGRDFQTCLNFSSKLTMKQIYKDAGIPTADFAIANNISAIEQAADRVGFPVIVKPIIGGGAINVVALQNSDATREFCQSDQRAKSLQTLGLPILVEKLLNIDAEYHCDGVVVDGTPLFQAVSVYLEPLLSCDEARNGSTLLPHQHPDATEVKALHEAAIRALNLVEGVTHLELFKTGEGWLCGEIAARVAGGGIPDAIQMRHCIDLWDVDTQIALGQKPDFRGLQDDKQDYFVNLLLPAKHGLVEHISKASDFDDIMYLRHVDMRLSVGDNSSEMVTSSLSSGIAYLSVPSEDKVDSAVQSVIDRFELRVSPQHG